MKKDKHSKEKVKPGKSGPPNESKQIANKPSPLEDFLAKSIARRNIKSHPLLYPFSAYADKPNPFLPDLERADAFCFLVKTVYTIALSCSNQKLEFGTKEERKELTRLIKKDSKLIPQIFSLLLPQKTKGARLLRYYQKYPEWLVSTIELLKQRLRKYLKASYKGKRGQKDEDIKKFWEDQFKEPYPEKIPIADQTETTISVSILAYRDHYSFDRLYKIYKKAKKEVKEYERINKQFLDF